MKDRMSIEIKGRHTNWCFTFQGDPKDLPDWHADGLDVGIVMNTIPAWAVSLGLLRPWVFIQDCWQRARLW